MLHIPMHKIVSPVFSSRHNTERKAGYSIRTLRPGGVVSGETPLEWARAEGSRQRIDGTLNCCLRASASAGLWLLTMSARCLVRFVDRATGIASDAAGSL